ncbi:hypothetical protein GEMRC1_001154 [Eukaryota sp. GEM-RC1]
MNYPKETEVQVSILSDEDIKARESVLEERYQQLLKHEEMINEELDTMVGEVARIKESFAEKEVVVDNLKSDLELKIVSFQQVSSEIIRLFDYCLEDFKSEPDVVKLLTSLEVNELPNVHLVRKAVDKVCKGEIQGEKKKVTFKDAEPWITSQSLSKLQEVLEYLRKEYFSIEAELDDLSNKSLQHSSTLRLRELKTQLTNCNLPSLPNTDSEVDRFFSLVTECRVNLKNLKFKIDLFQDDLNESVDENLFNLSSPENSNSANFSKISRFGFCDE